MRSWRSAGAALLVLGALASGCGGSEGEGTDPAATPEPLPGRPCPEGSLATYEDFGAPFMSNHCTGCHSSFLEADGRQGAPLGVDFETRAGIEAWRERIYARAGDANTTMPPAGGPVAGDRVILGDWLTCGMP